MPTQSRFDAEKVERLATMNDSGRFEIQLRDSNGNQHLVSLPVAAAVALGCLICEVSERTPFLIGNVATAKGRNISTSRRP